MEYKNQTLPPQKWLISKTLRLNKTHLKKASSLSVRIGYPRKLRASELDPIFPNHRYGCVIQTGKKITLHVVRGIDAMAALTHALLACELFLHQCSGSAILIKSGGEAFDAEVDNVFLGVVGRRYIREINSE
jgi:hypothetical protein